MPQKPIALTMGDPAGVGPEVLLKACADPVLADLPLVAVASRALLQRVADRLALAMPALIHEPDMPGFAADRVEPGRIAASNGAAAGACIELAIAGCLDGRYGAMATAPIHKQAIKLAGIPFPGHTEWLAARTGVSEETMMLYHQEITVA
jgi:4-hydroxy-L-threonine phosphate dehydrogenase PdxA